eukprot:gb/GECH01008085.1/.p1 GENE.gb/GECH01008085.1/~~gb/GECH01008085.1/.p1  ORF type:complete len:350 (+),score=76.98 gb/GECH01008085.1/:1-1050(+)
MIYPRYHFSSRCRKNNLLENHQWKQSIHHSSNSSFPTSVNRTITSFPSYQHRDNLKYQQSFHSSSIPFYQTSFIHSRHSIICSHPWNQNTLPFHSLRPYHDYTAADDHHEWGVTPNLSDKYSHPKKLFIHRIPTRFSDRFARIIVSSLRIPIDLFFAKRYGARAVVLETVAGVPGMVGGMWLHLKSLRRMEPDYDHWIHELLDEARNERMHLMTFMEIAKPSLIERLFVFLSQAVFWNLYFILFLISQSTAHRMVGYLEEEAVVSYTRYLKEIEEGRIENIPAPDIAKQYWQLSEDADLKELVRAVRADECGHRDRNHEISDTLVQRKGKEKEKEGKYEYGKEVSPMAE